MGAGEATVVGGATEMEVVVREWVAREWEAAREWLVEREWVAATAAAAETR